MIVREHTNEFVMIEQDNHAQISGEIASAWKDSLFHGKSLRKSVEKAIYNHDLGWKMFDRQPFWNDAKHSPYTFVDFPNPSKTVFYKHGVDLVAKDDAYAGLLCSRHYTRFLKRDQSAEAKAFVEQEEKRQQQIIQQLPEFNITAYDFHYGMVQFCDDLSLYICLNDPGTAKANEHLFFKNGLSVPDTFDFWDKDKLETNWKDTNTIEMERFPFDNPLEITIPYKVVTKDSIQTGGINKSYQEASWQQLRVKLINKLD